MGVGSSQKCTTQALFHILVYQTPIRLTKALWTKKLESRSSRTAYAKVASEPATTLSVKREVAFEAYGSRSNRNCNCAIPYNKTPCFSVLVATNFVCSSTLTSLLVCSCPTMYGQVIYSTFGSLCQLVQRAIDLTVEYKLSHGGVTVRVSSGLVCVHHVILTYIICYSM